LKHNVGSGSVSLVHKEAEPSARERLRNFKDEARVA
jgi:hypothetical protein